jgi:DNA-binding IclR family transcriptional regulator
VKVIPSFVERCLAVIELLAECGKKVRLGEIADRIAMPKGDLHRLLAILCSLGWAEQDRDTGFYALTLRLSIVGQRFLSATRVLDVCQPVLDRLARDSQEFAQLALVEGQGLTTIAQAQPMRTGLIFRPRIFVALPLHATASGKAWLATMLNADAAAIVQRRGFGEPGDFGPNAVRTIASLLREVEITRTRGWGLAREEGTPGGSAVAAVICPRDGAPVGVVTITGPTLRMLDDRIPEMARLVRDAAADLAALWPLRTLRSPMPRSGDTGDAVAATRRPRALPAKVAP